MNKGFNIINDPEYGFLRADPIPTEEEVEKFYKEEFYSSEYKRFNDSSLEVQKEEQDFFESRWKSIYATCEQHLGKMLGFSILDIGCGFAQALLYFRQRGLYASGLEPSPEAVEYARSQGLEVFQAGIEDFDCVGSRGFEIVTILNVLEHLRNPAATLLSIKDKLLKPGGMLVIDVPNEFNDFQTVADEEFGLKKWWICPPNHINYFSASSLSHLLDICGYDIKHTLRAYRAAMEFVAEAIQSQDPLQRLKGKIVQQVFRKA